MRQRRGKNSRIPANVPDERIVDKDKKDVEKKYDHPVLLVYYKDEDDYVNGIVVPFDKQYLPHISYKENFEDMASYISENGGGLWVRNKIIIPPHRILSFHMIEASDPKRKKSVKTKQKLTETKKNV